MPPPFFPFSLRHPYLANLAKEEGGGYVSQGELDHVDAGLRASEAERAWKLQRSTFEDTSNRNHTSMST